ncbi:MAG: hypothetical protein HOH43_10565 [Candidatus Latescibacteria bacterium]|jgi:hypothetical protein|nr:hypothetical protein [Candidatus Latescibacterota bacterium]
MSHGLSILAFVLPIFCVTDSVSAQIVRVWDLAEKSQSGQMTFYNPDDNDAQYGTPISSADLNGDGRADFIVSAMAADGPPNDVRQNSGEIHVYFSEGTIRGTVDFRYQNLRTIAIYGERSDDIFGIKHASGDFDNNGSNDLIVGAFYADGPGRPDAGKVYIIPGELLSDMLQASDLSMDLGDSIPNNVSTIVGSHDKSRLGVWMDAGDINGDGFDDVVVGADMAHGYDSSIPETGRVYIYYGPLAPGVQIDAADTTYSMTVIYGIDAVDHFGSCLTVGDVNGDGLDDIGIGAGALGTLRNVFDREGGAGDGPNNLRENAGEVVVVYGKPNLPRHIDLRTAPPTDVTIIYGQLTETSVDFSPDRLGEEIVSADINGDGVSDLLIGAYRADGERNDRRDSGEVFVVYGASTLPGRIIDLEVVPSDVTVVYGSSAGAIAGDSIAAGDIHGDGYDDLFIGIPGDTGPNGRRVAGGIVVIAGGPHLPAEIDLLYPQVPIIWVEGPDPFDYVSYWAASGDFDGDGRIDVMPNGMLGDGPANRRTSAGEAFIINGAILAEELPGYIAPVNDETIDLPTSPTLLQNIPNPFNSGTEIGYQLPSGVSGRTVLGIYNLSGQLVKTLVDATVGPGAHTVVWDGFDLNGRPSPSGLYLTDLSVDGKRDQKKLLLVR